VQFSATGAVVESFSSAKQTRQLFGQTYRAAKNIPIAASGLISWLCHENVTILSHRFSLNMRGLRHSFPRLGLKYQVGDKIPLNADDFARLSAAFFDEIEKKYL
jgi:hypothetical protein